MGRNEILKMVGCGNSQLIVAIEFSLIEAFAGSDLVSYDPWGMDSFRALGFTITDQQDGLDDGGSLVHATLPNGWKRTLNRERGWRVDITDHKDRLRGYLTYKPGDYAYTAFLRRYDVKFYPYQVDNGSAVQMAIWDEESKTIVMSSDTFDTCSFWQSRDLAKEQVRKFLSEKYPEWESIKAYWS